MASTQKIIEETVTMLAEHYGFDAKEAMEYVTTAKKASSPAYARAKKAADATRTKIAELEQKIADNKVKNVEKSRDTLAGLEAKLAEQMERIAKFETPTSSSAASVADAEEEAAPKEKEKKKRASKKTTKKDAESAPAAEETVEEAPKEKEKKKRASKKDKETADAPAAPPKEKRIARMTPTLSKQLKATFDAAKIEFADAHKKAFASYINEMADETFDVKSLPDHMRDFVATHAAMDAAAADTDAPGEAPTDKSKIAKVPYDELVGTQIVDGYGPGVYWDVTNKRFIRGPSAVADEDVVEVEFDGASYVVGEASKRVYLVGETDVFTGFAGVGIFKNMVLPAA